MWHNYFDQTKDKPPSKYLVQAVKLVGPQTYPAALDLGSGGGRDTRYLAQAGFAVTSVDAAPVAEDYLQPLNAPNITFILSTFEDFSFKRYDLINASFSLPFLDRDKFMPVWQQIIQALNPNGIFVGELFGVLDSWNNNDNDMTFHTKDEIQSLLAGFHIHRLDEEQGDGTTLSRQPKHWDIFHVIAQKK
jgi:tellurite methyltransferase